MVVCCVGINCLYRFLRLVSLTQNHRKYSSEQRNNDHHQSNNFLGGIIRKVRINFLTMSGSFHEVVNDEVDGAVENKHDVEHIVEHSSHQYHVKYKAELGVAAQEDHNHCIKDQSKVCLPRVPHCHVILAVEAEDGQQGDGDHAEQR